MKSDKELADKVVALGALHQRDRKRWPDLYIVQNYGDEPLRADEAVRDWRVAGALMERVSVFLAEKGVDHIAIPVPARAREIIENCVEVLS